MLERFTPLARQVVVIASDQARALQQRCIGAEHILLALAHPQIGLVSDMPPPFGISQKLVLERLDGAASGGEQPTTGQIPFSSSAIQVIHAADAEASALKDKVITPEHLLLGVLRQEEGSVAAVLGALNVDVKAVRLAIVTRRHTRDASVSAQHPTEPAVKSQREGLTSTWGLDPGFAAYPDEMVRRALAAASSRAVSEGRIEFGVLDLVVMMSGGASAATGNVCEVAPDEPARRALADAAASAARGGRGEFTKADLIVSLRACAP